MRRMIVTMALASVIVGGCNLFGEPEIQYYVMASDEVSITISGEGESTEQFTISNFPWTKEFTAERGDFLYVSAQVREYNGWVQTQIKVDGKVIDSAESRGDFVIATSSGSAD